jgi:hypothetical protein
MTESRKELLLLLADVSNRYPEMRFGQVLSWFATAARGSTLEAKYDAEDEELISAIRDHLGNPLARTGTLKDSAFAEPIS